MAGQEKVTPFTRIESRNRAANGEQQATANPHIHYKCPCGPELGRDFNAALNLRRYGEERA